VPPNSIFFWRPHAGYFLLQEEGVSLGKTMSDPDLGFLVGKTVVEIRGDQVVFEAGTNSAQSLFARVEATPDCADRAGEPLSLADLVGRSVASASAKGGVLRLVFADGATLRCEPDPEYEAWQVEGGHPLRLIVCRTRGELSVWDETPPIPYGQLRERAPAWAAAVDEMSKQYNLPLPNGFPPPDKEPSSLWRLLRRDS
jgi:hypothetical protein